MTRRHYVNNAPQRTLASPITAGSATCTISGTFAGWPILFPFYATLDIGQLSEEIVLVTGITGSVANITRGQDGTPAVSHTSGATLDFTVGAADFDEANAHVNANTGVHGISGSVVGTSDVQTLTNKTLTSPAITKGTHTGDATNPAITAKAGATNTAIAVYEDNGGSVVATVDAVTGFSGLVVPKSFTNEAAANTAGANVAGAVVYLTAPTTWPLAGLFAYTSGAWLPLGSSNDRLQAFQNTAQAIPAGAYTVLTNYTAEQTSLSGFNTTTGLWTCPATGTYKVSGQVTVGIGANRVIAAVGPSGATQLYRAEMGFPTSGPSAVTVPLVPRERAFAVGDQLGLMVFVSTAVSTNTSNSDHSFLRIERTS